MELTCVGERSGCAFQPQGRKNSGWEMLYQYMRERRSQIEHDECTLAWRVTNSSEETMSFSGSPALSVAWPRESRQAALRTRARSNTNPARPYICRLIVFSRFTCP